MPNHKYRKGDWPREHDAILRARFHELSYSQLGKLLGYSKRAVEEHAGRIGLRKGQPPIYTEAEDTCLRWMYATVSLADLAQALGRKADNIKRHARVLGIQSDRSVARAALLQALAAKPDATAVELAAQLGRTPAAVDSHLRRLMVSEGLVWNPRRERAEKPKRTPVAAPAPRLAPASSRAKPKPAPALRVVAAPKPQPAPDPKPEPKAKKTKPLKHGSVAHLGRGESINGHKPVDLDRNERLRRQVEGLKPVQKWCPKQEKYYTVYRKQA